MTLTLEIPPELEPVLLAQAQASGLSLEAYVARVLRERISVTPAPDLTRSQLAGQRIRGLREGVTLGGASIRELIDEGRE
jgi:hypothetical protein